MAHLAQAGGSTLSQLVVTVLALGLFTVLASSPAVRAGVGEFIRQLRENPVKTYFYGAAPTDDERLNGQQLAPGEPDGPKDTFDYSIFAQSNPPEDPANT